MSQEQQTEGFYTYNGNKYFKDRFGNWFVKDSGYESLFLSGIKDEGLLNAVHYELNTKPDAKINFQHEDKWYTIWNHSDSTKIKVDRKGEHNDAPLGNTTYDRTVDSQDEAKSNFVNKPISGASNPNTSGFKTSYSPSNSNAGKKMYFVDETKLLRLTPEEFEKGYKFEYMWSLFKDATENIKLVQEPNGDVRYHIILQHKKEYGNG